MPFIKETDTPPAAVIEASELTRVPTCAMVAVIGISTESPPNVKTNEPEVGFVSTLPNAHFMLAPTSKGTSSIIEPLSGVTRCNSIATASPCLNGGIIPLERLCHPDKLLLLELSTHNVICGVAIFKAF